MAAAPAAEPACCTAWRRVELLVGLGRPAAAERAFTAVPLPAPQRRRTGVLLALVTQGDTTAVSRWVRELEASARARPALAREGRASQLRDGCHAELWRLSRGDTRSAPSTIARLRGVDATAVGPDGVADARYCALFLDAQLAVARHTPSAPEAIARLDTTMGRHRYEELDVIVGLFLARAWEAYGDPARALRAVRRREWNVVLAAATQFREEGRLAARLGDRDAALRAYRAYLALRHAPEPALRAEVDHVRAEVARLEQSRPVASRAR